MVEPSDVVAALLHDGGVCGSCVEFLSLSRVGPASTASRKAAVSTKPVHFSPTNKPSEARYVSLGDQKFIMMTFENSGGDMTLYFIEKCRSTKKTKQEVRKIMCNLNYHGAVGEEAGNLEREKGGGMKLLLNFIFATGAELWTNGRCCTEVECESNTITSVAADGSIPISIFRDEQFRGGETINKECSYRGVETDVVVKLHSPIRKRGKKYFNTCEGSSNDDDDIEDVMTSEENKTRCIHGVALQKMKYREALDHVGVFGCGRCDKLCSDEISKDIHERKCVDVVGTKQFRIGHVGLR